MRILPFLATLSFLAAPLAAQVTGTVTDETGNTDITVAIPPFATPADVPNPAGNTAELGRKIAEIMAADLRNAETDRSWIQVGQVRQIEVLHSKNFSAVFVFFHPILCIPHIVKFDRHALLAIDVTIFRVF